MDSLVPTSANHTYRNIWANTRYGLDPGSDNTSRSLINLWNVTSMPLYLSAGGISADQSHVNIRTNTRYCFDPDFDKTSRLLTNPRIIISMPLCPSAGGIFAAQSHVFIYNGSNFTNNSAVFGGKRGSNCSMNCACRVWGRVEIYRARPKNKTNRLHPQTYLACHNQFFCVQYTTDVNGVIIVNLRLRFRVILRMRPLCTDSSVEHIQSYLRGN